MKTKNILSLILSAFIIIPLFSACSQKAEPIELPDKADIKSVNFTVDNEKTSFEDSNAIETVLEKLSAAEPTNKQSVNDTPQVSEYTEISFTLSDGESAVTVYLYETDEKYYAEVPYVGIYELSKSDYNAITDIYSSSDSQWQKQYLTLFNIDFISSNIRKIENTKDKDGLSNCFSISLSDDEQSKFTTFVGKNDEFYDIADKKDNFEILEKYLSDDFSFVPDITSGNFAYFNGVSKKLVLADGFSKTDSDFYTALIFDTLKNKLYIYNYSLS